MGGTNGGTMGGTTGGARGNHGSNQVKVDEGRQNYWWYQVEPWVVLHPVAKWTLKLSLKLSLKFSLKLS
jgi:hypothetical protein